MTSQATRGSSQIHSSHSNRVISLNSNNKPLSCRTPTITTSTNSSNNSKHTTCSSSSTLTNTRCNSNNRNLSQVLSHSMRHHSSKCNSNLPSLLQPVRMETSTSMLSSLMCQTRHLYKDRILLMICQFTIILRSDRTRSKARVVKAIMNYSTSSTCDESSDLKSYHSFLTHK